jgi:hypothetical protein
MRRPASCRSCGGNRRNVLVPFHVKNGTDRGHAQALRSSVRAPEALPAGVGGRERQYHLFQDASDVDTIDRPSRHHSQYVEA